ncbi:unnamed protein product [Hermetia illucens]|uniref:Odorant receptor n=1 Tax=Hermetia illucens TaxID=343691 RepID=A0A7R8UTJ1_HERIL|nr:putative odorant receptor 71a [Hermetia illucens]CAD7086811.1 unnamed protein product [Hermetia illucens]
MPQTSDLLRFHVSVFKFFGVWRSEDKRKDLLYSLRAFFFLICLSSSTIVLMFIANFHQTEFTDFIISPLYTINATLVLLKAVNFCIKTQEIEHFLGQIDKVPEAGEKDTKEATVRRIKILSMIHGFLFIFVVTSKILPTVVLGKVTTTRPIPIWYPFEWEGKLGLCLLLLLFEYSSAYTLITLAIIGDIFLTSVLLIIGGQLESLGYRLKNLPSKDTTMWRIIFKECVQDYNCIFKVNKEFERIFSGIIFIQASLSCLLICLSAFALGLANDIGTFILFFSFIFGMLYEVFVMCYAGDYLTEKSEELLFNLYSSSWPDIPRDCRKMVLIFCIKLNNPIIVKFGIIQDLHLRTFTKIVDAAYKLYALLQQVPE